MDEHNVPVYEDICDPRYPNVDSTKISERKICVGEEASSGWPLSAERTQSSLDNGHRSTGNASVSAAGSCASGFETFASISGNNSQCLGNSGGQQQSYKTCITRGPCTDASREDASGGIQSQMQARTTLDTHFDCTSSSQPTAGVHESSAPQQASVSLNDDFQGNRESREILQDAVSHSNQLVNASFSTDSSAVSKVLAESSEVQVAGTSKGFPIHSDVVEQVKPTDIVQDPVQFVGENCFQGEASVEDFSVAVKSIKNMQRKSEEGLGGPGEVVEQAVSVKEILGHDIDVNKQDLSLEDCGNSESSVKKSMGGFEDNGSFILNGKYLLREEFRNKDHFLNMLCELAAVQQQEQESSGKHFDGLTACGTSLVNDEASGDPRKPSFVDLLRKQMAQAGTLTEPSAIHAFYEQFLRANSSILGSMPGKDIHTLLLSAGISSNDGAVAALEAEQIASSNSDRDSNAPIKAEFTGDFRDAEVEGDESLVKCKGRTGDCEMEGARGEEEKFKVGDLVWAKVKSHPWWPGQIFDATDASAAAKRIQRPRRTLVAFFGDGTFGWLHNSQLVAFRPHFEEKAKQTTMKSFCRAVTDALNEVCKRSELGLRCSHFSDALYSRNVFPDLNAGIRKGVRVKHHQDIRMSLGSFEPMKVLKFVRSVACSPCDPLSLGLAQSELCGHFYGFHNFMLSPKKPKIKALPHGMRNVQNVLKLSQSSSLKRRLGADETGDGLRMLHGKETKRPHLIKEVMKKEQQAENMLQSPNYRTRENLLLMEADKRGAAGPDPRSPDHGKESTWSAKGKRLQASPDSKEGNRAQGWHSLGPLGDLAHAGAPDDLRSTDDDSKTLLDMAGYRLLKRRKKNGTSKCIVDSLFKEVEQQPMEAMNELSSKKVGGKDGNFPDSSTPSLITVVSDPCLTGLQITKQLDNDECDRARERMPDLKACVVEGIEKDDRELLDVEVAKNKKQKEGVEDLHVDDGEEIEEDKREAHRPEGTVAEEQQKVKGELLYLKVGDAKEKEKAKGKLLGANESHLLLQCVNDQDKAVRRKMKQLKHEHSRLQVHAKDKGELLDLKAGNVELNEKDKGNISTEVRFQDKDANISCSSLKKRKKQTVKCLTSPSPEHKEDKQDLSGPKVGEAEESEKDTEKVESVLQDVSICNSSLDGEQQQTKIVDSLSQEINESKGELPHLKGGDGNEIEIDEGKTLDLQASESWLQDANDHGGNMMQSSRKKQQIKCFHSQEEGDISAPIKANKRKQQQGGKQSRSSPKNECIGLKKPVKGSKLGRSIKKAADTLKNTPAMTNNLPVKGVVLSETLASAALEKGGGSPRVNQVQAHKLGVDGTANSSFTQHLNSLKAVAQDPSNMKSSLRGVMSAFLQFRSMVFLKSTGYGAAGAGKVLPSHVNGHLAGHKKTDVSRPGKQNLPLERRKSSNLDSSEDRKFSVKAEPSSDSVTLGSHRTTVQDSLREVKAAATKRTGPMSMAAGKLDVQTTSDGTETGNGGTAVCPDSKGGVSQKLGVRPSDGTGTGSGGMPVYPDSMGGVSQKLGVRSSEGTETGSGGTHIYPDGASQKLGVQELAVAARKRKSEVLKEFAAKVQAKSVLNEQNSVKERGDNEKHTDALHHAKNVKHHVSRAEALSLPERKSALYSSADARVAQTSLGIFMQFPNDFILPSEAQLKETFDLFGALEPAGIRVNRNASTAHVVFKHSADAEAAWQHARKNRMFGHANVSYRLRLFSASSRSNSKVYEITSAKNGLPAKATDNSKAPSMENHGRLQHSKSFLSSEAEKGLIEAAHSPARTSPSSRVEPMDAKASSPVRISTLAMTHAVCSSPRSMPASSGEPGAATVPVPSPVIRAEPVASVVTATAGNCSTSEEPGGGVQPARPHSPALQKQDGQGLASLSVIPPPLDCNPLSGSTGNVPRGDIQDEMLKLLQQVSFIVSSSTLTSRTT